jgi:hypothetical protein
MTLGNDAALRLAAAILVAVIAAVVAPGSATAEPSANFARSAQTDAHSSPAKPAAKTQRSLATQATSAGNQQARPWSIEDALPARSSAVNGPVPATTATTSKLGQIPWKSGTLSLETESQVNPYVSPEGRHLPGLETESHGRPSFLGLSLSVPTNDKLFPVPVPPPLSQPK